MLSRCRHEIQYLKKEVARLAPKADAYDTLTTVLGLLPQKSQGFGEDIIWLIDSEITKLKTQVEFEKEAKKANSPSGK